MGRVITPRPIAWVSTVGPDGISNAAPFSVFTGAVCVKPPMLCFAVIPRPPGEPQKDTLDLPPQRIPLPMLELKIV